MNRAVKFHRDVLGLPLKFESPEWSEFVTGETTLALHKASAKNAAGSVELGFTVPDLHKFYADMKAKGVQFSYAADEARLRQRTRAVRRFGRRTQQRRQAERLSFEPQTQRRAA